MTTQKYRENNRDKIRASDKRYREANKEKIKERRQKNRWKHPLDPEKSRLRHKKYRESNNEKIKVSKRRRYRELRRDVLDHYGKVCQCCGEDKYEFLSIDHVNGGGNKHKKAIGRGENFTRWLSKNGYPEGFRVLCHNCNQALGHYGYCPHQTPEPAILAP
jgi:hypothetical protein